MPEGDDIRCSASKLAQHVDVRANGGYVILPPSCRADGFTYRWDATNEKPTIVPDWLVDLLINAPRNCEETASTHTSNGATQVYEDRQFDHMEGHHHHMLKLL